MVKKLFHALPFLTCLTLACGSDNTTTGNGLDDNDDDEFGIACSGELALTGTFLADPTVPATDDCQPAGTWTINAAVSDLGTCDSLADAEGEYIYTISVDADTLEKSITYQGDDPENPANLQQKSAGSTCYGIFTHYIGQVELQLKPYLDGNTFTGTGTYERYEE